MEHSRMRENDWSPHPDENSAELLVQADPSLLTPNRRELDVATSQSTANSPHADKSQFLSLFELPRLKPLFHGFERPSLSRITILTVLCPITYPAFYVLIFVANDRSLFSVRLIVSVWCSGVGFALGYILLKIGARHLEAATWATVIHLSYEDRGMKFRDLARSSDNPTSFVPAFYLLWSRFGNQGTSRRSRKLYDKRPWSLFLAFFAVLTILGPLLPFLFGRIMRIETFVRGQRKVYREVLIAGDLSMDDVSSAASELGAYQDFSQTWTLLPYGRSTSDTAELVYGNDTVYFAQPSRFQFIPDGSGPGSFDPPASIGLKDTPNDIPAFTDRNASKNIAGVVLRYPQWGIRIHCKKLPNPKVNLIPLSEKNFTYTFIPRDFLQGLLGVYGMDPPIELEGGNFDLEGDTMPPNIDPSTISYIARSPNNGEGVILRGTPGSDGSGEGWSILETVLIRFNTGYTLYGRFPVYLKRNSTHDPWVGTTFGYDAAVCVRKYEPWIIETYNTSIGSPSVVRIIGRGDGSAPLSPGGNIQGDPITGTRYLNTSNKGTVFELAHGNSINHVMKDNGRDGYYLPSPTAISFTSGTGPWGYTELSPDRLATALAQVAAANALPYLAGSGLVVAQVYEDETLAYAVYARWQLIGLLILIWILGVIGELFVPTLPLGIPRRGFGVYSWLVLLQSQELRVEAADDLGKLMDLDGLEEKLSDKRVKFVV